MTESLVPRSLTWLTSLINAALAVLIGVSAALLALEFVPTPENTPTTQATTSPSFSSTTPRQDNDFGRIIASKNLFGNAQKSVAKAPVPQNTNAPKTKLNLNLSGVLAFEPQDHSLAIIRVGGGPENIFAIGDQVGNRATLKAVYADKAIIEHNGKLETLPLPRDNSADSGLSLSQQSHVAPSTPPSNTALAANLPHTPGALRERLIKEPQLMNQLMRVTPYQQNGSTIGYQLSPRQGAELLQSYGIYPGDVVTSLNGVSLTSQRRGLNAMRRLVNAKNLEMTVLRNGVEVPVSISFE